MEPVFVRGGAGVDSGGEIGAVDEIPSASTAAEIALEIRAGRIDLEISKSMDTGFFPLRNAFRADPVLRERFAIALKLPRILRYQRTRALLFLGLVPWLMLFELDREIAADDVANATARMYLDVLLLVTCAADLIRPVPRHPRITAIVFLSAVGRFCYLLARACGGGAHPLIIAAPFVGFAAAVATFVASPTREQIARDILNSLGLDSQKPTTTELAEKNSRGSLFGALAMAVLLPIVLIIAARYTGIWGEALVMMVWGFALPQRVVSDVDNLAPRGSPYFSRANMIVAILLGVSLTAALTGGVHYFVDAVAYFLECTRTVASANATKFIARESTEVTRNVRMAQRDVAFFVMTVIIAPIVEERVYRGALQRILGERFGPRRAIAMAAGVFGFAHLGIYRVAIYQTVLLGVAFGVAFEEGGLIASMVTHSLWNLYLLL